MSDSAKSSNPPPSQGGRMRRRREEEPDDESSLPPPPSPNASSRPIRNVSDHSAFSVPVCTVAAVQLEEVLE